MSASTELKVGSFVILSSALVLGGVIVLGSGSLWKETELIETSTMESVDGLQVGHGFAEDDLVSIDLGLRAVVQHRLHRRGRPLVETQRRQDLGRGHQRFLHDPVHQGRQRCRG